MAKVTFNKENVIAEFEFPSIPQNDYSKFISVIMECKIDNHSGKPELIIDPNFFSKETSDRFNEMQDLIHRAKPLIEKVDTLLYDIIQVYFHINDITLFDEKYHDTTKLDFMKRRDLLSEVLKNDTSIIIDELSNKTLLKEFTSDFCKLITERNIITHGILQLRYPENIFVIKSRNRGEYEHYEINEAYLDRYQSMTKTIFIVLNKLVQKIQTHSA